MRAGRAGSAAAPVASAAVRRKAVATALPARWVKTPQRRAFLRFKNVRSTPPPTSASPARQAHAPEHAEARLKEARRVLVPDIEQIVDARKQRHGLAQLVVTGEVNERVGIGLERSRRTEETVVVHPAPRIEDRARESDRLRRAPARGDARLVPGAAQKLLSRLCIEGARKRVVAAQIEVPRDSPGHEAFVAPRRRLAHVHVRVRTGKERCRVDEVLDVIVEVGDAEAYFVGENRLLEADIPTHTFFWFQVRVADEVERGKIDEALIQRRRAESGSDARLQLRLRAGHDEGRREAEGGVVPEGLVVVVSTIEREEEIAPDLGLTFDISRIVPLARRERTGARRVDRFNSPLHANDHGLAGRHRYDVAPVDVRAITIVDSRTARRTR